MPVESTIAKHHRDMPTFANRFGHRRASRHHQRRRDSGARVGAEAVEVSSSFAIAANIFRRWPSETPSSLRSRSLRWGRRRNRHHFRRNAARTRTCRVFRATPQFAALRRVLAMVVTAYVAKISEGRSVVNSLPCSGRVRTCTARCGGKDVVSRDGSADALKFKLPNRLDSDGIFDRHQDTRTDEY